VPIDFLIFFSFKVTSTFLLSFKFIIPQEFRIQGNRPLLTIKHLRCIFWLPHRPHIVSSEGYRKRARVTRLQWLSQRLILRSTSYRTIISFRYVLLGEISSSMSSLCQVVLSIIKPILTWLPAYVSDENYMSPTLCLESKKVFQQNIYISRIFAYWMKKIACR